jgi:hypothetical protein
MPNSIDPPPTPIRHLIDYGHMRDGVLYHGTISDLDGPVRATWTYEDHGTNVTRDVPISEDTFEFQCSAIRESAVFDRAIVRDQDLPIDPKTHHVIGIVVLRPLEIDPQLYLIPANEAGPEFVRWLKALNVPQGSL